MVDIDQHLDQAGVRLEKIYWCDDCNRKMNRISPGIYKCPGCGKVYREEG